MGSAECMKLWYTDIRELDGWETTEAAERLSADRREKIKRYRQKADVLRSVGAGLLLEYGLNRYGRTSAEVSYHESGKPMLAGSRNLFFNLTHSGNYAAVVFADTAVGIDMEEIKPGRGKAALRFLSEEEKKVFGKKLCDSLLTEIWTRKESYVKATGTGLRQPFSSFSVLNEQVREDFVQEKERRAEEAYYLKSFDSIPGYRLSVCSKGRRPEGAPERIELMKGNVK